MRHLRLGGALGIALFVLGCPRQPKPEATSVPATAPEAMTNTESEALRQILCGRVDCPAGTHMCCLQGGGSCLPLPAEDADAVCEIGGETIGAIHCDDDGDCAHGETCCWSPTSHGSLSTRCVKGDCIFGRACRDKTCPAGHACLPFQGPIAPGKCAYQRAEVDCGEPCKGATPVCCWNPRDDTRKCTEDTTEACSIHNEPPGVALRCLRKADCGIDFCCGLGETNCVGSCINSTYVCESVEDCPPTFLDEPVSGCVPGKIPGVPDTVKGCVYGAR